MDQFFNAAVLGGSDGKSLRLVCRHAYYQMDRRGFQVGLPILDKIKNSVLTFRSSDGGYELVDVAHVPQLDGVEDLRFFEFGGKYYFFGVGLCAAGDGLKTVPVVGYCRSESLDTAVTRNATENVGPVEKNWVYFEEAGKLFIEKYPGMSELYRVDPENLELEYLRRAPTHFRWSGTKGVRYRGGMLFLDHRRVYILSAGRTAQRYVYRFRHVVGAAPPVVSGAFRIGNGRSLVYVSDLHISPDNASILLAASTDDAAFDLLSVPNTAVLKALKLTVDH